MKALNTKERNLATLRFALWLFICVVIICVPVILTTYLSQEQRKISTIDNENMMDKIAFEKDFIAHKIQKVIDLTNKKKSGKLDADTYNAELTNIFSDINGQIKSDLTWRGDMYRNMVAIAQYLIVANKIVSKSGEDKAKQTSGLDQIILELEGCHDDIKDLTDEKKRKDIYKGVNDVEKQVQKILRMLDNYKASL